MLRITWYGHAAFLLEGTTESGDDNAPVRIALDPYRTPDVGGYAPIEDTADIVAISHENVKYHSNVGALRGTGAAAPALVDGLSLLDTPQPRFVNNVPFTAVRVWENDARQEPIAMVGVTLGGVRVLHMGDAGHALSPNEVAACGPVDVLLALAGGPPTLALPDLADFVRALAPPIVIPMHFGNPKINLNLRPVDDFLGLVPPARIRRFDTPTVEVRRGALPGATEVWVLPPAR